MTLRLRLVVALVLLATVGLASFGVGTYFLYSRSQYDQLDAQVRQSVQVVTRALLNQAGRTGDANSLGGGPGGGPQHQDGDHDPNAVVAPGTYAELRTPGVSTATLLQVSTTNKKPKLPASLKAGDGDLFTVGSVSGSGQWRVLVSKGGLPDGSVVVIAEPLTQVESSLNRLVLLESAGGAALLLVLFAGSWLILRHGLRPLERMATTARSISAGDLSQRVEPDGGPTEVGQLGQALNTMLSDIEVAFREREATELKLRRFLSDASHELRTPLTSIQGFAELFRIGGDEHAVDLPIILRRIEQESARMKDLVEDLLLLARLDETRSIERAPVDLSTLAADACSDAVANDPSRKVTLDAPEPLVIQGDETHLRQAVANLVTNAIRHTPDGSPLEVRTWLDDDGRVAVLSVRDHGPGFDPEALAHVFDRFWQADAARVGTGSGLGLSIVAGIAAEHHGSATAANAPDGGAIVSLRIPVDMPIDAPAEVAPVDDAPIAD